MILKYSVPKEEQKWLGGNSVIYCKIKNMIKTSDNQIIHLVNMINYNNYPGIFNDNKLKKINIWDRIKLLFI